MSLRPVPDLPQGDVVNMHEATAEFRAALARAKAAYVRLMWAMPHPARVLMAEKPITYADVRGALHEAERLRTAAGDLMVELAAMREVWDRRARAGQRMEGP